MRVSELKKKEIININDCRRLGFAGDIEFDLKTGCVLALIVSGPGCFCGFLGHDTEYVIPYKDICQVGEDIILVDVKRKDVEEKCKV